MKALLQKPVDINRGTLAELVTVNGIGPSLAKGIIDARPFESINELVKVPGINETKLATLIPYITLEDKTEDKNPFTTIGGTQAFVFLEDRNERQDAMLIVFGGFIFGLILLLLRRSR
jgi:hypothetical protein